MSRRKIDQAKLQYWAGIIHDCQHSGLKTNEWLTDHGISSKKYSSNSSFVYLVLTYLPPTIAICSFYISSLSKRKSITLIFKMPLSSYQRFPISFLTTILGKESPVSVNGLSSTSAFSSVGIAYADWM